MQQICTQEMKTIMKTAIGINTADADKLIKKLNVLLANYQLFYMNVRGFHWNIKGNNFFELHVKFEELYNDLQLKVDELAERILTLGGQPLHSYTEYIKIAKVKEHKNISNGHQAMKLIVDDFSKIFPLQRELLKISSDADDEGTNGLMSDYLRAQEKMIWMYNSYLNK